VAGFDSGSFSASDFWRTWAFASGLAVFVGWFGFFCDSFWVFLLRVGIGGGVSGVGWGGIRGIVWVIHRITGVWRGRGVWVWVGELRIFAAFPLIFMTIMGC
jgi:hypothetical protein